MKESLRNIVEVSEYLQGEGYRAPRSTLYFHRKKGLLKPDQGKQYSAKAVMRYATEFLLQEGAAETVEQRDLHRRKIEAEIRRLEEMGRREQIKRMADEGRYVLKEVLHLELAARAAAFESELKFSFQVRAGEWIDLVGGDHSRTADLIREATRTLNEALNVFAARLDFSVKLESTQEGAVDG